MQEKIERLKEFYTEHVAESIMIGVAGLCCIVALSLFVAVSLQDESTSDQVIVEKQEQDISPPSSLIYVDVAGAVRKPGVYTFTKGARLHKAMLEAGGLSDQADLVHFSKNINQARIIEDQEKIYIPSKNEGASQEVSDSNLNPVSTTASPTQELVNINTASQAQLEGLPGIGKVTAEQIINNRPYTSLEELSTQKILKSNVYEQIKNSISL